MQLRNKVSIITGAASGIGKMGSLRFSQEGARVVMADINREEGQKVEEMIRSQGGEVIFVQTDVSRIHDVRRLIQLTLDRYGKIDIMWSNAGIVQPFLPIEHMEEELFDRIMSVNVKGAWLCAKESVPSLKQNQKGGVILFTSSLSGFKARPHFSVYQTSKGAVNMLVKSLAKELAPFYIRVNSICPVAADTPMLSELSTDSIEETRKNMIEQIPLKRLGTVEDMANVAIFLASDKASFITGVNVPVDGGTLA